MTMSHRRFHRLVLSLSVLIAMISSAVALRGAFWDEYKSGIVWPEPVVVTPGEQGGPPSDALVLFDGHDLLQWHNGENWIVAHGFATAAKTGIRSKQEFGSCQLHLEFATPEKVEGEGQGRGNSGVYLMGKYEIQILDSYQNSTYFDGQCAAIYKQQPPMVNACRRPGEWQSYDIIFEAPEFTAEGQVARPAYVTVLHNGVVVQHHQELQGSTSWDMPAAYQPHPSQGPIDLQFHGNPIRFRNIWIRENVQPLVGKKP